MKKFMFIIKKIVMGLCMLYTFNVLISKIGLIVPINIYSVSIVSLFDVFGIVLLVILKKLII